MAPPTFSQPLPKSHIQKVGTKLELEVTCATNEKGAKFSWKKPQYASDDSEHVNFVSGKKSSKCVISAVQIQDEGDWACELETPKGKCESLCSLVVYVPKCYRIPVFLEELQAKESLNGTVALECKVIGVPTPTLRWFKGNHELQSGDLYELKVDRGVQTIYKCVAVNCVGSAASEAILETSQKNVHPPSIVTELKDVRAKIGSKVQLDVIAHEKSSPCTSKWTHKGTEVTETKGKYELSQGDPNHFSLVIVKADLDDDGEWNVCISNSMGKIEDKCMLTLKVPKNYRKPMFVENLKAHLTDEGMVSFECKVVGFPTPTLTWLKDGRLLTPGDVYELYGNQSIGVYTCVAKNCMGTETSTSSLTIEDLQKKPKDPVVFISPLIDQKIPYGGSYQIFAQVSSKLQLPFSWKRNGSAVNFPEYVIGCEEDGKYFCNIVNATMQDEGLWELNIEDNGEVLSSSCNIQVPIPQHFKAPKFLDNLRIHLTESGTVSLECKVIGIPQPKLRWFKDEKELQAGDLHKLVHDKNLKDNTCIFGVYKCVAYNCMGETSSSAKLIGFDNDEDPQSCGEKIPETKVPTDDSFEEIDVSSSFGGKSVALSMSDVPDLSSDNAQQIVEMFANELEPQIVNDFVELPPLRFVRETSKASNISIEAVVIDIDEQSLLELETSRMSLENIDDLNTEADLDDISEDSGHSINTIQHFEIEELEEAQEAAAEKVKAEREEEAREATPLAEHDNAEDKAHEQVQKLESEDIYATVKKPNSTGNQKNEREIENSSVDGANTNIKAPTDNQDTNEVPQEQATKLVTPEDQAQTSNETKGIEKEVISERLQKEQSLLDPIDAPKLTQENEKQDEEKMSKRELKEEEKERPKEKDEEHIQDATEQAGKMSEEAPNRKQAEQLPKKSEETSPKGVQKGIQGEINDQTLNENKDSDGQKVEQTPSKKGIKEKESDGKYQGSVEKDFKSQDKDNTITNIQDSPKTKNDATVGEDLVVAKEQDDQKDQDNLTEADILKLSEEIESVATKLQNEDRQKAAEEVSACNPNYFNMVLEHKPDFQDEDDEEQHQQNRQKEHSSKDDGEDLDEEVDRYLERRRRSNSYEDTIKNLDPELLKELGLDSNGDQLEVPTNETNKNMASRVDEKASQLVKETAPSLRRSRSRSRSRSRPPNLDTVEENYSQELQEALYYGKQRSNLEDIKECPSCSSVQSMESQIDRSKSIPHNHPVPDESLRGAKMSIDMDIQFDLNRSESDDEKERGATAIKSTNLAQLQAFGESVPNNGDESTLPMLEEIPSSELEQLASIPRNISEIETTFLPGNNIDLSQMLHVGQDRSDCKIESTMPLNTSHPQTLDHDIPMESTFLTEVVEEPGRSEFSRRVTHETRENISEDQTMKPSEIESQHNANHPSNKPIQAPREKSVEDRQQDSSKESKKGGDFSEVPEEAAKKGNVMQTSSDSTKLQSKTPSQPSSSNQTTQGSKDSEPNSQDEKILNQRIRDESQCIQTHEQDIEDIPLDSTESDLEFHPQSSNNTRDVCPSSEIFEQSEGFTKNKPELTPKKEQKQAQNAKPNQENRNLTNTQQENEQQPIDDQAQPIFDKEVKSPGTSDMEQSPKSRHQGDPSKQKNDQCQDEANLSPPVKSAVEPEPYSTSLTQTSKGVQDTEGNDSRDQSAKVKDVGPHDQYEKGQSHIQEQNSLDSMTKTNKELPKPINSEKPSDALQDVHHIVPREQSSKQNDKGQDHFNQTHGRTLETNSSESALFSKNQNIEGSFEDKNASDSEAATHHTDFKEASDELYDDKNNVAKAHSTHKADQAMQNATADIADSKPPSEVMHDTKRNVPRDQTSQIEEQAVEQAKKDETQNIEVSFGDSTESASEAEPHNTDSKQKSEVLKASITNNQQSNQLQHNQTESLKPMTSASNATSQSTDSKQTSEVLVKDVKNNVPKDNSSQKVDQVMQNVPSNTSDLIQTSEVTHDTKRNVPRDQTSETEEQAPEQSNKEKTQIIEANFGDPAAKQKAEVLEASIVNNQQPKQLQHSQTELLEPMTSASNVTSQSTDSKQTSEVSVKDVKNNISEDHGTHKEDQDNQNATPSTTDTKQTLGLIHDAKSSVTNDVSFQKANQDIQDATPDTAESMHTSQVMLDTKSNVPGEQISQIEEHAPELSNKEKTQSIEANLGDPIESVSEATTHGKNSKQTESLQHSAINNQESDQSKHAQSKSLEPMTSAAIAGPHSSDSKQTSDLIQDSTINGQESDQSKQIQAKSIEPMASVIESGLQSTDTQQKSELLKDGTVTHQEPDDSKHNQAKSIEPTASASKAASHSTDSKQTSDVLQDFKSNVEDQDSQSKTNDTTDSKQTSEVSKASIVNNHQSNQLQYNQTESLEPMTCASKAASQNTDSKQTSEVLVKDVKNNVSEDHNTHKQDQDMQNAAPDTTESDHTLDAMHDVKSSVATDDSSLNANQDIQNATSDITESMQTSQAMLDTKSNVPRDQTSQIEEQAPELSNKEKTPSIEANLGDPIESVSEATTHGKDSKQTLEALQHSAVNNQESDPSKHNQFKSLEPTISAAVAGLHSSDSKQISDPLEDSTINHQEPDDSKHNQGKSIEPTTSASKAASHSTDSKQTSEVLQDFKCFVVDQDSQSKTTDTTDSKQTSKLLEASIVNNQQPKQLQHSQTESLEPMTSASKAASHSTDSKQTSEVLAKDVKNNLPKDNGTYKEDQSIRNATPDTKDSKQTSEVILDTQRNVPRDQTSQIEGQAQEQSKKDKTQNIDGSFGDRSTSDPEVLPQKTNRKQTSEVLNDSTVNNQQSNQLKHSQSEKLESMTSASNATSQSTDSKQTTEVLQGVKNIVSEHGTHKANQEGQISTPDTEDLKQKSEVFKDSTINSQQPDHSKNNLAKSIEPITSITEAGHHSTDLKESPDVWQNATINEQETDHSKDNQAKLLEPMTSNTEAATFSPDSKQASEAMRDANINDQETDHSKHNQAKSLESITSAVEATSHNTDSKQPPRGLQEIKSNVAGGDNVQQTHQQSQRVTPGIVDSTHNSAQSSNEISHSIELSGENSRVNVSPNGTLQSLKSEESISVSSGELASSNQISTPGFETNTPSLGAETNNVPTKSFTQSPNLDSNAIGDEAKDETNTRQSKSIASSKDLKISGQPQEKEGSIDRCLSEGVPSSSNSYDKVNTRQDRASNHNLGPTTTEQLSETEKTVANTVPEKDPTSLGLKVNIQSDEESSIAQVIGLPVSDVRDDFAQQTVIKRKDGNKNTYLHTNSQNNRSSKTDSEATEVTITGDSSNLSGPNLISSQPEGQAKSSENVPHDIVNRDSVGNENEDGDNQTLQRRARVKRTVEQKTPDEDHSAANSHQERISPPRSTKELEKVADNTSSIPQKSNTSTDVANKEKYSSKNTEGKTLENKDGQRTIGVRSRERLSLQHNEKDAPDEDDGSSRNLSTWRMESPRLSSSSTLSQQNADTSRQSRHIDEAQSPANQTSSRTIRPYTGEAKVTRPNERRDVEDVQRSTKSTGLEASTPARKYQRRERNEPSSVIVSDNTLRLKSTDSLDPPEGEKTLSINVKEIGHDWVSLNWKKPYSSGGSVIVSYKIEAWLCGEGAYWMELGRTPITQYDVFNLKPKRQYYFRVTAKSKRGVELQMMTKGKVDLAKSTKKPEFTQKPSTLIRAMRGHSLVLECEFFGEPPPSVTWTHSSMGSLSSDTKTDGTQQRSRMELKEPQPGRVMCQITNEAGSSSTATVVDVMENEKLYQLYLKFYSFLHSPPSEKSVVKEPIPPFFVSPPRDKRAKYGYPVQIRCLVGGDPTPRLCWYKQGTLIKDENSLTSDTLLEIDDVNDGTVGEYEVCAENKFGKCVSRFVLIADGGLEEHIQPKFMVPLSAEVYAQSKALVLRTKISASPYVDGRHKKTFKRGDGNRYRVDINSDEEHLMGRVLYLIVRQGVNGYVVPINTSGNSKNLFTCQFDEGPNDTNSPATDCDNQLVLSSDAFCRVGDDLTATLGHVPRGRLKIELDHDSKIAFRPKFNRNSQGKLEVTIVNATKDFEGTYKFKAAKEDYKTLLFQLNLVIMEKRDNEDTHSLDNPSFDSATPHPSNQMARLGGLTPRSTPRCSPFQSPRSTPARSLRSTPSRCGTPGDEDEDRLRRPHRPRSRLYPKFLSSLNDRCVVPGTDVELKCYVLSVPGLKTSWMKDGKEIVGNSSAIESRGMRSLTLSNVSASDSGVYTVRMEDAQEMTDISSSCRIEVKEQTPLSRYDGMSSTTRSSLSRSRPNIGSSLGLPYQSAHQSVYRNNYQSSYLSSGYRRSYW
ncbi:hypothetical protein TCAL_10078 [Tigriopus californicus]|uniref:Uncharacterized protein n=1 Tax=Tigriopus californicus TaxID=6832 RepID=A0A553N6Y6_TIGCA|nr:hypothetical protein TCAL_10078 [Tigriopus californicus]|eukprot:TCALIF_10078-PA protein Name:"Similar to Ttn Titin (Mus musculus)" AED:0.28 eAED:0.02 QI:35/0.82/0.83/1/1/1/18/166/4291